MEIFCYPNNRDEFQGAEVLMMYLYGRTSGIYGHENFGRVSAVENSMNVDVADAIGWITDSAGLGCMWANLAETQTGSKMRLSISAASGTYNRIDRVVVAWNPTNYINYPEIKILKGTAAANPVPPALTNTAVMRQLSLARIEIPKGATSIKPENIIDERYDPAVCGLVTNEVEIDTQGVTAAVRATSDALKRLYSEASQSSAYEQKRLSFENKTVSKTAWVQNGGSTLYPYRADIALSGVTSAMDGDIIFSENDAGMMSPTAETYNGGIYIRASSIPDSTITIPRIRIWR